MIKDMYHYYNLKRECKKLYSEIISLDTQNINNKTLQWELYNTESKKVIDRVTGEYNSVNIYDEIFCIGDTIKIHYMDIKTAIIQNIKVELNTCTWHPEYIITAKDLFSNDVYRITYNTCIHLTEH